MKQANKQQQQRPTSHNAAMFRPIGLNVIIIFVIFIVCNMPRKHNDVKLEHCRLPHWYINNVIFLIVRIVKNTDVN